MSHPDPSRPVRRGLSSPAQIRKAAEAAFRIEWPRLVAGLTRMTGDIDTAEDLAQDAMVAAVEQWPRDGVPVNPGGWLMLTAKHRAIDRLRRDATLARKLPELAAGNGGGGEPPCRRAWIRTWPSRTICCAWSSSPATRSCRRPPGWR
jgi:hypothetical protein